MSDPPQPTDAVERTKADPTRSYREDALVAEIERLRGMIIEGREHHAFGFVDRRGFVTDVENRRAKSPEDMRDMVWYWFALQWEIPVDMRHWVILPRVFLQEPR